MSEWPCHPSIYFILLFYLFIFTSLRRKGFAIQGFHLPTLLLEAPLGSKTNTELATASA